MIETDRLVLRPWTAKDRPIFAHLMNTPGMMAHLGGVQPPAAIEALFDKRLADQARDGIGYWAVEWRKTGEMVGSCAHNYPDTPVFGRIEAGWRIAEAWWRRGLAVEAMIAALDWGWANRAMPFVLAWTTEANRASLAVMGKLGFRRAPDWDFVRADTGMACMVHRLDRPRGQII